MHSSDSEVRYTLVVAAAGIGKRMNLGYPKQFLEYKGKPLFIYPLETAQKSSFITDIVVVTGKESQDYVKEQCEIYGIEKVIQIVEGGAERQNSIYRALQFCKGSSLIAVQDGVRPFLEEKYLSNGKKILDEQKGIDGVVTGVPVKDTIKIVDENGNILSTPPRVSLMAAQTPQIFRGEVLQKAYDLAEEEGFLGTDDSSLVERIGKKVIFSMGSYENIKVTTQEDLKFLYQEEK